MTEPITQPPPPGKTTSLSGRRIGAIALCILAIPLALLAIRSDGQDFRAFHVAARAVAAHLDPYMDNRMYGERFADLVVGNGTSRWIYPPPALFFVVPLGIVSYKVAKALFAILSIASLLWTILFLGRRFNLATTWLVLACISLPVIACLQRGQVDLLILFCVVLAYRLSGRFWAGIPLGVAISIKIFPAALLLWWLLEKKFKQAATAVAFLIAINLLALWRFGLGSYTSFLHNITTLHSQTAYGLASGQHAPSLLANLDLPHLTGPWFAWSAGFVGSYNNPLILLESAGITVGFLLTIAAAILLRYRQVGPAVGFFSMALLSQMGNTTLWTMGMVMYIPICFVALHKLRSNVAAMLLLLPLYLPSQIRIFDITPRFVTALLLVAWIASRTVFRRASEDSFPAHIDPDNEPQAAR